MILNISILEIELIAIVPYSWFEMFENVNDDQVSTINQNIDSLFPQKGESLH